MCLTLYPLACVAVNNVVCGLFCKYFFIFDILKTSSETYQCINRLCLCYYSQLIHSIFNNLLFTYHVVHLKPKIPFGACFSCTLVFDTISRPIMSHQISPTFNQGIPVNLVVHMWMWECFVLYLTYKVSTNSVEITLLFLYYLF